MSTIDASQCWRIMPYPLDSENDEWWVLGPDNKTVVPTTTFSTKKSAFDFALKHNKKYGVPAVWVHESSTNLKGGWERETVNRDSNPAPFS
jgi:hypothetical protein